MFYPSDAASAFKANRFIMFSFAPSPKYHFIARLNFLRWQFIRELVLKIFSYILIYFIIHKLYNIHFSILDTLIDYESNCSNNKFNEKNVYRISTENKTKYQSCMLILYQGEFYIKENFRS